MYTYRISRARSKMCVWISMKWVAYIFIMCTAQSDGIEWLLLLVLLMMIIIIILTSISSIPPGKRIKHFRWNEISHGKFGGKHFRPGAPACIHIIIHTSMLRLLYLMRHIHLNYSGLLVAVSACACVSYAQYECGTWLEISICASLSHRIYCNNVWLDNTLTERRQQQQHARSTLIRMWSEHPSVKV